MNPFFPRLNPVVPPLIIKKLIFTLFQMLPLFYYNFLYLLESVLVFYTGLLVYWTGAIMKEQGVQKNQPAEWNKGGSDNFVLVIKWKTSFLSAEEICIHLEINLCNRNIREHSCIWKWHYRSVWGKLPKDLRGR